MAWTEAPPGKLSIGSGVLPSTTKKMLLITVAIYIVAAIQTTIAGPAPLGLTARDSTPSTSRIQAELGPKLCKGGSIYFPSSPEFGNYTTRWSTATEGSYLVVIVPACEKDVATAVSPPFDRAPALYNA